MSPLDEASDDVLRAILDECGQRELYHLSLVSRRLRILAEPRLYSTIHSTWTHIADPITFLLLRTVLARPLLAIQIRKLVFQSDSSFFNNIKCGRQIRELPIKISPQTNEEELMKIVAVVRDSGIPAEDTTLWNEEIRGGSVDAPLAVLLSLLPNLASISLDDDFTRSTTSLRIMLKHVIRTDGLTGVSPFISDLKSLRTVTFPGSLGIHTNGRGITVQKNPQLILFVLLFLYSPSIQHLSAIIEDPGLLVWPANTACSSSLTSLFLSKIREANLGQILSRCPSLQTLSYYWYVDQDGYSPLPPFLNCYSLDNSLLHIENSLKSLRIATEFQPTEQNHDDNIPPRGIIGTIKTLPNFLLLEKLEIPFILLLGPKPSTNVKLGELLPPNLRQLALTDSFTEFEEDGWEDPQTLLLVLTNWLDDSTWKTHTPQLKTLELFYKECYQYITEEVRQQFKNLDERFGVRVQVTGGVKGNLIKSKSVCGSLLFLRVREPRWNWQMRAWFPQQEKTGLNGVIIDEAETDILIPQWPNKQGARRILMHGTG
ncbi:hypothetical protein BKA65DRAFT_573392 [Rhexocercosporidium sp. MPI-PUGE-AT-0058]|nr:hypothetical protein BKA65DRAFT_573392 [Rhexocercosporidium sp. MPI-PUGE-AT-0058]